MAGRGAAWTKERGTSDEGRRRVKAPRQRAAQQSAAQQDTDPWGGALRDALTSLGAEFEAPRPGACLVTLRGTRKLTTMTWLIAGTHSLQAEAFFCRQPDENHAAFYRFLLERGGRMYGVHFALDPAGDVYLVGKLPLAAISTAEIDRLLGCVLSYADETFDQALMLGFASAIRKEYAWRVKRGESLANLQAFARLTAAAGATAGSGPGGGAGRGPRLAAED